MQTYAFKAAHTSQEPHPWGTNVCRCSLQRARMALWTSSLRLHAQRSAHSLLLGNPCCSNGSFNSFKPSTWKLKSGLLSAPAKMDRCNSRGSNRGRSVHLVRPAMGTRAMFTGIVEEIGRVRDFRAAEDVGTEITIEADLVLEGVKLGDSIAVNGTCLTVTEFDSHAFTVGLSPETLRKTSLGEVIAGSGVNLERALQPTSRMGGHFVQGHVDGTGQIVSMEPEGDSLWIKVRAPPALLRYIVPKGFIAVDGTSLTVVDVFDKENCFNFMLVAYTQQKVVIAQKRVGNRVNLEVDILGKYVERLLSGYKPPGVESGVEESQ